MIIIDNLCRLGNIMFQYNTPIVDWDTILKN